MHRRHRHLLPKTRRDGLLSPDSHRRIARLSSTSRDYNPGMRVGPLLCSPLAAVLCSHALAYPGPPRGTENIPKLMADSALVCKGEVDCHLGCFHDLTLAYKRGIGPPFGTENIPKLMADSALVCKAEVVDDVEVAVVSGTRPA